MKLRKTLRIARWEVGKNAGQLDRRTLAIGAVVLLAIAALTPMVAQRGVTLDDGIYRVGVAEDSPYYEPVEQDPTFVAVEPEIEKFPDEIDVFVTPGGPIIPADTPKGQAALSELRNSVGAYNDGLMRAESDQAAAFPVEVSVRYVEQDNPIVSGAGSGSTAGGATNGGQAGLGDESESDSADGGTGGESADGNTGGSTDDGTSGDSTDGDTGGSTDDGTGGDSADGNTGSDTDGSVGDPSGEDSDDGQFQAPSVGGSGSVFGDNSRSGTPSDVTPPFPFESLVLAFAFVLPMNFVIQAYASTILEERVNQRGELLLVSPVSRGDIIAGKTLPYFLGMIAIASLTAIGIAGFTSAGDGLVAVASTAATSVAAVIPIALLFLASSFVGAMFARSFKELTFVTVTLSVFLTAYAFIPAIFTTVHPIAAISPLTLVVESLLGSGVSLGDYVFSTLPLYLSAGVLFALGAGVYREEDMFTQRPVPLKFLDSLDGQISGPRSAVKLSALSIPFVFVGELLAVALLFALPGDVSIPVLLFSIALIEEVAKSIHVYAGFAHDRFSRSLRSVGLLGFLSGLGFFLGEKATAVAQLVGLPDLELGQAAFGTATGLGVEASPLVLVGLLLAPLALHAGTATITVFGASRDRKWYLGTLVVATLVHAAYNLTVVSFLG